MNRIGIIDIGSNSVRMVLSEFDDFGYFKVIDELKETIRIGADLIDSTEISEEKIALTISTLKAFKSMCINSGATKIITVATEVIRQSTNKNVFKERLLKELDLEITILDYDKEIYYNFLGASNTIYSNDSIMVDISGNITHLAWIKDDEIHKSITIPIGSVNLSKIYNLQDTITYENSEKASKYVRDELLKISWLKENNFNSIIGIGGSIRNIGKIDRRRKRYPIDISHNYSFTDYDLHEIYSMLKSKSLRQRQKIDGLSCDRADIIVGAAIILETLKNIIAVKDIRVCGRGLREGLLFEYLGDNFNTTKDMVDYSIEGIINTLNINKEHAHNVYNITSKLFKELQPLHRLNSDYDKIVETSALLHDCGISIRYYDHHIHSFYVILNSHINGLSHKEILMSAFCAAFHRNNNFQIPLSKFSTLLNRLDVVSIEKIGILLRVAEGLDRSLSGAVEQLDVTITKEEVILDLYSSKDLDLEIRQASRCKCKFKDIYYKDLIIRKHQH